MLPALMIAALLLSVPGSPRTLAERTEFARTSRYDETLEFCRRLDRQSSAIHTTVFGTSPEGRDLILVVASAERAFTAEAARRTGKPIVLIQAGIHAGEIAGKDAGLMLLRDIAASDGEAALLDHAIILFMPIYNVDGHERFGRYNRINQNGPERMGWRVTARNLNLNRDYMKADAAETRAWLGVFTSWWPDLTIDCHTTDGGDYQYDVTYLYESGPNAPPPVGRWIEKAVNERVVPDLVATGHLPSRYISFADSNDPAAGVRDFGITRPMFSNGYTVLQNRPSLTIEAHAIKSYRARVKATYDMLRAFLREVNRDPDALKRAVHQAEEEAIRPGRVPLRFRRLDRPRKVMFKGVKYHHEPSDISGASRIVYDGEPEDFQVSWPTGSEVSVAVDKPFAYIVPAPWRDVIEVLQAHGIRMQRLTRPATVAVESYRLTEPVWQEKPFEGRHRVRFKTEPVARQRRSFPIDSVVIPMDQPSSRVAVHLLEPQGPDSFVAWGFFDAIFERKEYAEAYVLERLARKMLADDPALRGQFEKALEDPDFANDPRRRLEFFHRRSPYRDDRLGLYPVGRIRAQADLPADALSR